MKTRILLICTLLVVITGTSYAQRYDDASNVSLSVGILKNGVAFTLGYETYINKHSSFVGEFEYLSKSQQLHSHDVKATFTDLLVAGKYRRYFAFQRVYPFISGGAFVGYEILTNKNDIPPSVIMDRQNAFIYGITTDVGLEYSLKTISFTFSATPRYDLNHNEFITSGTIGFKYYF